jgi:thymidylate synthase
MTTKGEESYLNLLKDILENGELRHTRNSITLSDFSKKIDIDISESFPLLTTKKMFWKGICSELLWFIHGKTDSKILEKNDVNIWKANSSREFLDSIDLNNYKEGDIGPMYGFQWRHFNAKYKGCDSNYYGEGYDQLQDCIHLIRNDPTSRRIFMSAWNPTVLKKSVLAPCHLSYQFYVNKDNYLSCILYQRSADTFLGLPFNIASVSLLVYILANMTDKKPGRISIIIGDAHIYQEHIEAVKTQLKRKPFPFPQLRIKNKHDNINDYIYEDFEIVNYECHPTIKAKMIA